MLRKNIDNGYPDTNIETNYIVECGSMLGGSAIRMATVLHLFSFKTHIL